MTTHKYDMIVEPMEQERIAAAIIETRMIVQEVRDRRNQLTPELPTLAELLAKLDAIKEGRSFNDA